MVGVPFLVTRCDSGRRRGSAGPRAARFFSQRIIIGPISRVSASENRIARTGAEGEIAEQVEDSAFLRQWCQQVIKHVRSSPSVAVRGFGPRDGGLIDRAQGFHDRRHARAQ